MDFAEALEGRGWQVVEASSGDAAMAIAGERVAFDLLVTDIRLPGETDGWDVADAFRATDSAIGVIYCSGNAADPRRQVSGSIFLSKPCRRELLLAACERVLPRAPE